MNILDKIIAYKRNEVANAKARISEGELIQQNLFNRKTFSLKQFLLDESKQASLQNLKDSHHLKE